MKTLIIALATLMLSACGGGGSGSNAETPANTSTGANQPPTSQSFKETSLSLMKADERSEPMDILAVNMDMDADDDEEAFTSVMSSIVEP